MFSVCPCSPPTMVATLSAPQRFFVLHLVLIWTRENRSTKLWCHIGCLLLRTYQINLRWLVQVLLKDYPQLDVTLFMESNHFLPAIASSSRFLWRYCLVTNLLHQTEINVYLLYCLANCSICQIIIGNPTKSLEPLSVLLVVGSDFLCTKFNIMKRIHHN